MKKILVSLSSILILLLLAGCESNPLDALQEVEDGPTAVPALRSTPIEDPEVPVATVSTNQADDDRSIDDEYPKQILVLYTNDEHGWMNPINHKYGGATNMKGRWLSKEKKNETMELLILSGGRSREMNLMTQSLLLRTTSLTDHSSNSWIHILRANQHSTSCKRYFRIK